MTLVQPGHTLSPVDPLYGEIVDFLHHEAELLDGRRFEEWLALLADDLTYRLPVRLNARDGEADAPTTEIFSDDLASLRLRVRRLGTGFAWAETPPSRTRHFISNVRVRTTEVANELDASSYFLVYRSRASETTPDLFSGQRQDRLRHTEDGWRLAARIIQLDQAVIGARHLSIFL